MNTLHIRKAVPNDVVSISALMAELGYPLDPDETESRLLVYLGDAESVLVADCQGEVTGFVSFHAIPLFHTTGNLGRITAMCVSSKWRRQGVGKALLAALDEVAIELGCVRIEVSSGDQRAGGAHVFYQSCGYELDSRRFQKVLASS